MLEVMSQWRMTERPFRRGQSRLFPVVGHLLVNDGRMAELMIMKVLKPQKGSALTMRLDNGCRCAILIKSNSVLSQCEPIVYTLEVINPLSHLLHSFGLSAVNQLKQRRNTA